MTLIRFEEVSLDIGDQKILTEADLSIEPGERVCLIGRNGAGKSTTFRLITDEIECDRGEIVRKTGLVVSQLEQSLPDAANLPVRDVVRSGLTGIQATSTTSVPGRISTRKVCENLKPCIVRLTPTEDGTWNNASKRPSRNSTCPRINR